MGRPVRGQQPELPRRPAEPTAMVPNADPRSGPEFPAQAAARASRAGQAVQHPPSATRQRHPTPDQHCRLLHPGPAAQEGNHVSAGQCGSDVAGPVPAQAHVPRRSGPRRRLADHHEPAIRSFSGELLCT